MRHLKKVVMHKNNSNKVFFESFMLEPHSSGLFTKTPKDAVINLLSMLFEVDLYKARHLPDIEVIILPDNHFELTINSKQILVSSLEDCLIALFNAFVE